MGGGHGFQPTNLSSFYGMFKPYINIGICLLELFYIWLKTICYINNLHVIMLVIWYTINQGLGVEGLGPRPFFCPIKL